MRETDIQRQILDYLKAIKVYAWRQNTMGVPLKGGGFRPASKTGVSDIIGVLSGGQALFIEVKQPKKDLTENQKQFKIEVERQGALHITAHSVEEVISGLKNWRMR